MPRKIQKRQNTFLRRKQIIDALRKLIIEYGSENVTVRRIAKEVGVSQAAIYRYFTSKREILSFLVDFIEESLMVDVEKSGPRDSSLEILENILRNHISANEQRRGIPFLVIAEIVSLGDKRINRKIFEVVSTYVSHVKGIIAQGVKSGEIKLGVDPEIAATVFFSIVHGLVTTWALSNYSFALEEKYPDLWKVFRNALKNP